MKKLSWPDVIIFGGYQIIFVVLTVVYILYGTWNPVAIFTGLALYSLAMFGATGGYHRLFSHKTYQAHPLLEKFYLFLGCLGLVNSAATWSYEHRIHHAKTDTLEDPYSIKRGFFYAHMGWFLYKRPPMDPTKIPDLWSNKWVRFQHQYYTILSFGINIIIVVIMGFMTDWLSSIYLCFFAWLMAFHHSMFSINSLAHTWGSKTYAKELTAVDNFFLAFLTFGEGYHNYHHAFPNDYRNGISWYHFDPTKWLIWILEKLHLAKNLRSKDGLIIRANLIQKDLSMVLETLRAKLPDMHMREKIAARFEHVARDFEKKVDDLHRQLHVYHELLQEKKAGALIRLKKLECLSIQKELKISWKLWKEMVEHLDHQYVLIEH
ncbi:acyl-CoA desaturase [Candidatus Gracilibacteria bacterium]|nr:acyl-CoA desaturase [Candidatus Gracilibacteria bacterium]